MTTADLAVVGDRVFRFEDGPGAAAFVAPDVPLDGPIVTLADGRAVRQVRRSLFESVFHLSMWTDDGERVDADPVAGCVGDGGLVQLRVAPPLSGAWTPALLTGASTPDPDREVVRWATMDAIAASAPHGWREVRLECRITVRRMEVSATVTDADGGVVSWSPPAIVGQWLHRLRLRHHRSLRPKWFTARFVLRPGQPVEADYVVGRPPRWRVRSDAGSAARHLADDWRLLPVHPRPDLLPAWQVEAGLEVLRRQQVGDADEPTDCEMARLFDGRDADGRPVWHRAAVDAREAVGILRYLENAPVVLSAVGTADDEFTGEPAVPMAFHTDGRWVWSAAVAHYLDKHGVPPVIGLVDHIRNQRYRLPEEVPRIAMGRAAALASGRPWEGPDAEFAAAVAPVVQRFPGACSLGEHRDGVWCLVRDGDWYRVYRDDRGRRFGDVEDAVAYLAGRLVLNPLPPITDALRTPNGWVWLPDPDADPRLLRGMPPHVYLGAYRVGPTGEPTGETYVNPEYRPGPTRRGFPQPHNDFERLLAYAAADWLPRDALAAAALDTRFLIETDETGVPVTAVRADGRRCLALFTSPAHLPPAAQTPVDVTARALLPLLPGAVILINPGGLAVELPGDWLTALA
ncbi:SseB family protein [Actinokineospora sp. UTMC 2448]|uniref:SseB family protein n=1 Tax=Actinokineospora sp. UTMC 2448 TaxID=2268449 RepID=UPI002164483E|nr:SseB family protein [Actinokineospora sp. UTMC 2448]UVS76866.1 hypothetical protein Actkin_00561 [Actinokineospora sp. UTMC 2448]